MKNSLLLLLFCIGCIANAQSPQLNVKGKDSSLVRLNQLKVNVKVVGNIAYTTTEMHFFNGTNRQMEAELLFPLPEGVSVSRYAIDIDGKIREAVPVNKNKGKQVFEAVEHRRVDPGLLEKVEGNNFRTRIYPLLPNKERIVIIGYEQELTTYDATHLAYQMVSSYPIVLDEFEMTIAVVGTTESPTITNNEGDLNVEKWNQSFQSTIKKNNYKLQDKVTVSIPIQTEISSVVTQSVNNQHYFYANMVVEGSKIHKKNPNSIGLIWDVSLSCRNKDVKKEIQLLDAYFNELKSVEVTLYFAGYTFDKKENFSIKNGDWSALKKILENTIYDGGTRFSKIKLPTHDEYLFFTDGLSSLSSNGIVTNKKPIYTISSLVSSDYAFLNYNALQSNGSFINLNQLKVADAFNKLVYQNLTFLGVKENYLVTDMYPMIGTSVAGNFSVSGISLKANNELTLLFGYNETPILEKKIAVDVAKQSTNDVNIEKLWAQKKIANLEIQYQINAEEIETLGKKYGIITQNTSLIVLESIADYIQYDIIPPAELREEFDKQMKQQRETALATKKSNWESVENYYNQLQEWWTKDHKYTKPKPIPKPKKVAVNSYRPRNVNFNAVGNGNIKGVVYTNNWALPGATIKVKGTTTGTQADAEGRYTINAKQGDVLEVAYLGMNSKSVTIGNSGIYNVKLTQADLQLNQVVVRGYGSRSGGGGSDTNEEEKYDEYNESVVAKKQTVAYSMAVVRSESIVSNQPRSGSGNRIPVNGNLGVPIEDKSMGSSNAPVLSQLQGRVAGVTISNQNALSTSQTFNWTVSDSTATDSFNQGFEDMNDTKLQKWNPDRVYLKALAAAPEDKKYNLYLELRKDQVTNPNYYFDVANYYYDKGNKTTALLVLSNIADLGLENHQLYKSLTYVLRQWEANEDALFTANQVAKWREQEPQAHRDLALTLEDNKQYQAAFDELIKALEVNYYGEMTGQYEGVEDIILMDINRMLDEHKSIKSDKLDKKYTTKMPIAIRIILNWNQMDTDIDLHVIEPTGEECYYAHRDTQAGARFSKDFTEGYGPEQYLLRNAVKGKYVIKTNYYGERALTENGPTTVMVEIYTTKADGTTERKLQTIQLGKIKENQNLAEITIE
jgi:hypothetical protein